MREEESDLTENAVTDAAEAAPRQTPMLARGVGTLLPPATRRFFWKSFYGLLAYLSRRASAGFSCMNWGYDDPDMSFPGDLGPEHFSRQLYLALTHQIPLESKTIAEISCGRGGGLDTVHRYRKPASSAGVDLTPGNIALCKDRFGSVSGLSFQQGDAMNLPFADASLDALLTVEASHCYPDERRFMQEAARVLRPGGWLLWTDFRLTEQLPAFKAALSESFAIRHDRDITPNVLSAMSKDAPRRQALIAAASPPLLKGVFTYFAAADGETESVRSFKRGERIYFLMQLQRL